MDRSRDLWDFDDLGYMAGAVGETAKAGMGRAIIGNTIKWRAIGSRPWYFRDFDCPPLAVTLGDCGHVHGVSLLPEKAPDRGRWGPLPSDDSLSLLVI